VDIMIGKSLISQTECHGWRFVIRNNNARHLARLLFQTVPLQLIDQTLVT
jgi:hypothetical protein